MENEYSFLHIQESDDEHRSTKFQAIPRFFKFYVMYVSAMWICHPQATCVCCTHRTEVQACSFGSNPKPRHVMLRRNQDSAAQNASVAENVTTNETAVQIKLLKRAKCCFLSHTIKFSFLSQPASNVTDCQEGVIRRRLSRDVSRIWKVQLLKYVLQTPPYFISLSILHMMFMIKEKCNY